MLPASRPGESPTTASARQSPVSPIPTAMNTNLVTKVGFLAGVFLLVNVQFPPNLEQGFRVTDYVGAAAWVGIVLQLLSHRSIQKEYFVRGFAVLGLLVVWFVLSVVTPRTFIDPVRWVLSLGVAATLVWGMQTPARPYVLKGIVVGGVIQFVVVLLQFLGYFDLTVAVGLTAPDSDFTNAVFGRWRPPGMYGTNATPAVAALGIPAALELVDKKEGGKKWLVIAVVFALATCVATLTRSTVLVVVVVLGIWAAIKVNNVKRVGAAALVFGLVVTVVAVVGPPGGWERWQGTSLESDNAQARIQSTVGSFWLATSHPLGIGRERFSSELQVEYGKSTTHNALTYLALAGNLPLALLMLTYLLGRSITLLQRRDFETWLALTMLGLCFWEEYFRNPVFIVFGLYVILVGILGVFRPSARATALTSQAA